MDRTQHILSHQATVNKAVKIFIRKNPTHGYLKHDLRSAGQIALIQALDRGVQDAHLIRSILSALSATVDLEANTIRVPARTQRHAKQHGSKLEPIQCEQLPPDLEDGRGPSLRSQLLECCANETERTIVEMLTAGYNQRQIAKHLQTDFQRVSEMKLAIQKRLEDDEDGTDEPYTPVQKGSNGKCSCGQPVARWSNADTCEDCFADDSQRCHGRSQTVNMLRGADTCYATSA